MRFGDAIEASRTHGGVNETAPGTVGLVHVPMLGHALGHQPGLSQYPDGLRLAGSGPIPDARHATGEEKNQTKKFSSLTKVPQKVVIAW